MVQVKAPAKAAFARQLRAWRAKKGWSQVELGVKLGYSDALISGVENGHKTPTADFAARCDEAFGAPGTFAELQDLMAREAWPSYYAPALQFEAQAVRINEYSPIAVPGLMQTEDYARCVISSGLPFISAGEREQKVKERLDRQQIFERPAGSPTLWEVIAEGALRHLIGSPQIMRAQLDKLIAAAQSPGLVIQVLPFSAYTHPGTDGPILIFDFANEPSVVYSECDGGGMLIENHGLVIAMTTKMSLIRAAALPPHESLNLLRQIRDEIS